MLHLFKSAASRAITYGLVAVLAIGLSIGAIRLALPFADHFRSELEDMLTETLGLEVRVGRLKLGLVGLTPQLRLRDAVLLDPNSGHPQLSLRQLDVELSPIASLRRLSPAIESVTLVGAKLAVRRLSDGSIAVSGLETLEAGEPGAMTFFFGNGRFLLAESDLVWIDEQTAAEPLHLSEVRVHFENSGERHRVLVLARSPDDPQTHLRLVADMQGAPGRPSDWGGEIYLHWEGKDLGQVLAGRLPRGLLLGSDSVELESWNRLEASLLTQSLSRILIGGLALQGKPGNGSLAPLRLDQLRAFLRWRRSDKGWRLEVKDLAMTRGDAIRPVTDLGLDFTATDDGGWKISGGNQFLSLSDARDLVAQLPRLPTEMLDALRNSRPEGELHDLRFDFRHHPELPPRWTASGRVSDFGLDARGQLPGARGLSVELAASERAGKLSVSADDLVIDLPRLFPAQIRLDALAGEIHWRRDAEGALRIEAREIAAGNADIATRSRLAISLPADGGGPLLDLHTKFRDVQVAAVRRYIPSRRLKEKLAGWLERAFVEGRIPSGALLFRGKVSDFPFEEQQGRFQVLFAVEDLSLDFHRDWPRIEALAGEVLFQNREMRVFATAGRFLDSALSNVSVRIPNLKMAVAIEVRGTAEGPFADELRVLAETPLREQLGAVARTFEADGVARLELEMAIPLRHKGRKGPLRLAGGLSWPGPATLAIPALDIELGDLAGELRFTESTLEAQSIEAKLWDVPLHLDVETREPQGNAGAATRIRASGRFPIPVLARQFPSAVWEPLKGRPRLELDLEIAKASLGESVPPIDFDLSSDLDGLALELPAPLGKAAASTRRLHLAGRLSREEPLRIQGDYGDLGINLGLERDRDKLRLARGTFNLGGDTQSLPKSEGLYLSGSIPTLDLKAWLQWWADQKVFSGGDAAKGAGLGSVDLRVEVLQIGDAALSRVHLEFDKQRDRWEGTIDAGELAGKLSIPHQPRREPIRIALERLDLKGVFANSGEDDRAPTDTRHADPRRSHTLDLSVERLQWGENPLGRLSLRSQAVPEGMQFTNVALAGPSMSITGRGSWLESDAGPRSDLSLTAQGSGLGAFLGSLELNSLFRDAPAEIGLSLSWPGSPFQFSPVDLDGKIQIDIGAGSLPEVEPGVGRMLGILNLETLQRRLTLDFSDLFGRGFAFETISGRLDIEKGTANIEELVINGPSANISIAGSTDLVAKELDQIVTVTPRIGTGVAIASAVAGGPLVGAAVFLADRVSGGAVDSLGRHQYVLTGPWAEPEIRPGRLGAENGEKPVSQHFLKDSGRAGAAGTREEPKPRRAGAGKSSEPGASSGTRSKSPPTAGKDENLFLEAY